MDLYLQNKKFNQGLLMNQNKNSLQTMHLQIKNALKPVKCELARARKLLPGKAVIMPAEKQFRKLDILLNKEN